MTKLRNLSILAGVGALLVAGSAQAQAYDPTFETDPTAEPSPRSLIPGGASLSVGGGVSGFTDSTTNDFVNTGGTWEARVGLGTQSRLGVEAAYVGSANDIDAFGLDSSAVLLGNGLEGNLRLNLTNGAFQPYAVGGLGWTRYSVVNADFNNSRVADRDDVLTIPLGAGLSYRFGNGAIIDGRATYRATVNDDLIDVGVVNGADASSSLNNWAVTARLGWEF